MLDLCKLAGRHLLHLANQRPDCLLIDLVVVVAVVVVAVVVVGVGVVFVSVAVVVVLMDQSFDV